MDENRYKVCQLLDEINNPLSFGYLKTRPSMDMMGLSIDNAHDTEIAACIGEVFRCREVSEYLETDQMRTFSAGSLVAKIEHRLVTVAEIKKAAETAKNFFNC